MKKRYQAWRLSLIVYHGRELMVCMLALGENIPTLVPTAVGKKVWISGVFDHSSSASSL